MASKSLVVAPAADQRNYHPASSSPYAAGVGRGATVPLGGNRRLAEGRCARSVRRRAAFASDWDDRAAAFQCSDEMLNRIWELCRYSIKATTFAGVYVDGDRERISYEADAYLTQLSRYYTDGDVQMARDTFDRLMAHPTWPTEWAAHMIFMAHADWMQTGDARWLASRYSALKAKLQLEECAE